jgi:hypothetical protein
MMRILLACLAIALSVTAAPAQDRCASHCIGTDYTDFLDNADHIPSVVTMNNARGFHFTSSPDPRIPHVLRGWGGGTRPADHVVMAPVRWFNQFGLDRFLAGKSDAFAIEVAGNSYTEVSLRTLRTLRTLPDRPRVRVLGPAGVRYAV